MTTFDWARMFKQYAELVGEYEGVDFLYQRDWTVQEWQAIEELWDR